MNWHFIEAHWTRLKGKIKEEFGELTDDDVMEIEGKREALIGKLQLRYNISREEAEQRAASLNIRTDDDGEEHKSKHEHDDTHPAAESTTQVEGNYEAAERFQREQHEFAAKMDREGKSAPTAPAQHPLPQHPLPQQTTTTTPATNTPEQAGDQQAQQQQ